MSATTLAEKIWNEHVVAKGEDGQPDLIYIDLHLIHEVTSPQAFDGLRQAGRPARRRAGCGATRPYRRRGPSRSPSGTR